MNGHDEIRAQLAAYSGGDLTAAERSRVEAHLSACAACRVELADLETVHRLLHTTPQEEPPPWLTTRIMARVHEQQQEKRSWLQRLFVPLRVKLPLELAALLLVSISGYYLAQNVATELNQPAIRGEVPAQAPQPAPPAPAPPSKRLPETPGAPTPAAPARGTTRSGATGPAMESAPPVVERNEPVPAPAAPPESVSRPAFAPAPPASRERMIAPSVEPFDERPMPADRQKEPALERVLPAAPKPAKKKAARKMEQEMPSLKAYGSASDNGAASQRPAVIRLRLEEGSAASSIIRQAINRVGGVIIDQVEGPPSIRAQVPAARINDLLQQLAHFGTIVERPQQQSQPGDMVIEIFW
jgi:anti-sigma factor RsiW